MTGISLNFLPGRILDEDWVDILNHFWTVLLLAACSMGAFLARYLITPISCFVPAQFTNEHSKYASQSCFLDEVFYHFPLPFEIPKDSERGRIKLSISWHLWIPLILFLQAVCFKAPNVIWSLFKRVFMININDTISSLEGAQMVNPENRHILFKDAALVVCTYLQRNRFLLGGLYLTVKLLFCLNLIGQFIFLTIFFRHDLGIKAGESELNSNYTQIPVFPRTVICEFQVRMIQNVHKYTAQCQLPINEIFAKCYIFLWYWVLFVTVITSINFVVWIGFLFVPFMREHRIASYVRTYGGQPGASEDRSTTLQFINNFLGIDGVFLLTMIGLNGSELAAADLAKNLFQIFKESRMSRPGQQAGGQPAFYQSSSVGTGEALSIPPSSGHTVAYGQTHMDQASAPPLWQTSAGGQPSGRSHQSTRIQPATDVPPTYTEMTSFSDPRSNDDCTKSLLGQTRN